MEQETSQPTGSSRRQASAGTATQYGKYRYKEGECIGGRYYVHRCASGGYGHVYLCYNEEQDYFYALKTLKLSQEMLEDPNTFPRLKREVNLWVTLGEHAHLVQCFTLEVIDNLPFIVLEWVADNARLSRLYARHHYDGPRFLDWYARLGGHGLDLRRQHASMNRTSAGTSLSGWIKQHRLSPLFAVQVALDICAGLSHVQSVHPGFVHRDLKPANVLLTEQLRAKVTDLGTAVVTRDLIDPGGLVGTDAYMAPEQWRGEAPDVRTDMYALGCVLYEMLAGQTPFLSPDRSQEYLRRQHEIAPVPNLRSHSAGMINEVVQTCLQKEPSARFSSLSELVSTLTTIYETLRGRSPAVVPVTKPLTVEDLNKIAVTYYNLQQYELALASLERAIVLNPLYADSYTNRGCVYHVMGAYQEALSNYNQAIRLGHRAINAKVRNNRGLLYMALGQTKRALDDLRTAIDVEPDYDNAHANLGLAYTRIGNYDKALLAYERALELNTKHVLARHNRGYVFQHLGLLDAALKDYTAALEHDPTFLQAYINRQALYTQLGHDVEAEYDREQFILQQQDDKIEPDTLHAAVHLSRPDPQFVNIGGMDDFITRPIVEQQANRLRWEDSSQRASTSKQMPLDAVAIVEKAAYADWLHTSIQSRQNQGQRVTQLSVRVNVRQADGKYQPFPEAQDWNLILDDEAMRLMETSGLRTIYDLVGRRLILRHDHPDDDRHPLRIWNIL